MTVGDAIRRERLARGLTQQALADKARVRRGAVSLVETGHRRARRADAERLMKTLGRGITLADMAGRPLPVLDGLDDVSWFAVPATVRDAVTALLQPWCLGVVPAVEDPGATVAGTVHASRIAARLTLSEVSERLDHRVPVMRLAELEQPEETRGEATWSPRVAEAIGSALPLPTWLHAGEPAGLPGVWATVRWKAVPPEVAAGVHRILLPWRPDTELASPTGSDEEFRATGVVVDLVRFA